MKAKRSISTKALVLLLAVALVFDCAAGGTFAWLVTRTPAVTNTFTTSDINITLKETAEDFKMVPGTDIVKDPKVTVEKNSEACWLFVKVDAVNGVVLEGTSDAQDYVTYAIDSSWNAVEGETGVYYREVASSAADQEFAVLANNKVHVLDTVTDTMMETAKTTQPKLSFTAYAVQKSGFETAKLAWAEAENLA